MITFKNKSRSLIRENAEQDKYQLNKISDSTIRENARILLENQKNFMLNEDFGIGLTPTGLNQGIPAGGQAKGAYAQISSALVRRVFPNLFANVLVGVQPMTGPIGQVFAIRNIYHTKNPNEIVEAAWKAVDRFSGFTGSTANASGIPDAGTAAADVSVPEHWKLGGDAQRFEKMPELGIQFQSQPIQAQTRKLAASMSKEVIDDIKTMQGIDIMKHMLEVLQYEMTAEIDRETIGHCKALCNMQTIKAADDKAGNGWVGRWSQERFSNMITIITNYANQIGVATRRGTANIAVVSPNVATALEASSVYFNKIQSTINQDVATKEIGTLNGKIRIFRDDYAADGFGTDNNEVLLAYKGNTNDDAGVIFCPYVTNVVDDAKDPYDFSPRVGIMSRYAFCNNLLGAENYYRHIKFDGLFSNNGSMNINEF
ncbi:MAG: hypothetical protein MJZ34_07005 [Paludibacteraceae bacterium]|nr:hypothetical protein [Paludibacteraceae bacterium]